MYSKTKGFTLIELLLGIGIATLGAVSIYVLYSMVAESNDAFQETRRLVTYAQTATATTGSSGNFSNINIEFLEDYGIEVDQRLGLNEIISPDGASLNFNYVGVPAELCSKFAANVLTANSGFDIIINGREITENEPIAEIATSCGGTPQSNITYRISQNLNEATLTNAALIPPYNYDGGNPNSIAPMNLNPLTPVIVVSGTTVSDYTRDNSGVGFNGGAGTASPWVPPVPEFTPPVTPPVDERPNPIEPPPSVTLPVNAKIDSVDINFDIPDWDYINVLANRINVQASGLTPNTEYRIEFLSQSFGLIGNNPVSLSGEVELGDTLTVDHRTDMNGNLDYTNPGIFDISEYFRTLVGENLTNPSEPMNESLKYFLKNSFQQYQITIDLIDKESGELVSTKDILPSVSTPPEILKYQTFHNSSLANSPSVMYRNARYDGEANALYGEKPFFNEGDALYEVDLTRITFGTISSDIFDELAGTGWVIDMAAVHAEVMKGKRYKLYIIESKVLDAPFGNRENGYRTDYVFCSPEATESLCVLNRNVDLPTLF